MSFFMSREQQVEILTATTDRSLRHLLMQAFTEHRVAVADRSRAFAVVPVATAGAFIGGQVGGLGGDALRGGSLGLATGMMMSSGFMHARRLKRIRKAEAQCLERGAYAPAAMLRGLAIDLMVHMPYSRTRAAIACIDLINYSILLNSPEAVLMAVRASAEVLETLPNVGRRRFERALLEANTAVAELDDAGDRVVARLGLIMMAETAGTRDIAPVFVDVGADLYAVSEENIAQALDPTLQAFSAAGHELSEEEFSHRVQFTIDGAESFVAEGLRRMLQRKGGEATDRFVRDVVSSQRMATRAVLGAYLDAMKDCQDPRAGNFGDYLADGDASNQAALTFLGMKPERGPEPPAAGR